MANLDKRMDPDKNAGRQSGRVKDGVSGNVNESPEYEENKAEDLPDGAAPDVVRKGDASKSRSDEAR